MIFLLITFKDYLQNAYQILILFNQKSYWYMDFAITKISGTKMRSHYDICRLKYKNLGTSGIRIVSQD